jgi:hypothetical protein
MSSVLNFKVKFENSSKQIDISFNQIESIADQIDKFQIEEEKKIYHLYNIKHNKFITKVEELKQLNKSDESSLILKNCTEFAKNMVSAMIKVIPDLKSNKQDVQLNSEIKNIGYSLQNYLLVDCFLEEFISYEGINTLVEAIEITSGNSRSYLISAFNRVLIYSNALEYIKENPIVVNNLYHVLYFTDTINTITHTLSALSFICEYLKPEGLHLVYNAANEFSKIQKTNIFKELVQYINHSNIDIKVNSLMLICCILEKSAIDRPLQAKILVHFQEIDLHPTLEKNASECLSHDFQIQLSNYQRATGEIIRGSNYEVEIYKKKYKDLEIHCQEIEKKAEFIFLNQKYYEEIVDDFIFYKKLSDTCIETAGYFDPCNLHLIPRCTK